MNVIFVKYKQPGSNDTEEILFMQAGHISKKNFAKSFYTDIFRTKWKLHYRFIQKFQV